MCRRNEQNMTIRERIEQIEADTLSPYACLSINAKGRDREEPQCDIRPVFQRDRDRILHSKSFRRLKSKTQVFLTPMGDHYRTRLTHTPTNDMRALRPAEIGFFRYCSERKQWEVILNNQPPLVLRRGMTAEQITQYSSSFVQIHQSYIINIDYLMIIKDSKCMLYPPFDKVTELLVSRKYKKELQDRFCL